MWQIADWWGVYFITYPETVPGNYTFYWGRYSMGILEDNIFKFVFWNAEWMNLDRLTLNSDDRISNELTSVQLMVWPRIGDTPLSDQITVYFTCLLFMGRNWYIYIYKHFWEYCRKPIYLYLYKTKTSKFRVTGLCRENPPVIGVFPSERAR